MGSVSFHDIRKSYGSVEVLHGIDFEIEEGEFTILADRSGCGKSTLLRMLAGLEDVTSGEIRIDDVVVNKTEIADRVAKAAEIIGLPVYLERHPKALSGG